MNTNSPDELNTLTPKIGDQVEVVNYGSQIWIYGKVKDISPGYIGKIGIIVKKEEVQGSFHYALEITGAKYGWYNQDQLKVIYRPSYL